MYILKYILVGDTHIGKSSILNNYINNIVDDRHIATIGVDFGVKELKLNNNRYKLRIWDTAGQEKFKSIIETYFRNVIGIILVYDITDRSSFTNLQNWIDLIQCKSANQMGYILVANKSDKGSERVVSEEEGKTFALLHNMQYIEVSAIKNTNIDKIFEDLTTNIQTTIIDNDPDRQNKGYILSQNNIESDKTNASRFINLSSALPSKTKLKSCCNL
jgi:small GTP-binding protein